MCAPQNEVVPERNVHVPLFLGGGGDVCVRAYRVVVVTTAAAVVVCGFFFFGGEQGGAGRDVF